MAEVPWIKLSTTMFEDEKIDFIESLPEADTILVIWAKILTLAGKCNCNGYIMLTENIPYDEKMLAHKFKRNLNTVSLALETFVKLGMLTITHDGFYISNWEKHQNVEKMEQIKEQNRLRKQNQRERQKLLSGENYSDMSRDCHVTCHEESHNNVTLCHNESHTNVAPCHALDLDLDLDKDLISSCPNFQSDEYEKISNNFSEDEKPLSLKKVKESDNDPHLKLCTALSKKLFEYMKINNPKAKEPNFLSWSKSIDLMIRVDKRTPQEIEKMIQWCQRDFFWRQNILSTDKLRQKYDQLYIKMTAPANGVNKNYNKNSSNQSHNVFQRREYEDSDLEKYYVDVTS
jgi:predicted phage replisome organizer